MEIFLDNIAMPENIIVKIIGTGIILLFNPSSRFMAKRFIAHAGFLTSKSELRIGQITQLVCAFINLCCVIALAVIWGVEPKNVIIVFSSLFTVIGVALFAQWSILSNITAGIVIFFTMPFRIGDEIEILDKDHPIKATVENVMTFTIHLRTEDGDLVVMSNTLFFQKVLSVKETKNHF